MNEPGLIHAYIFDGNGGGKRLGPDDAACWKPENGALWLHFDYSAPRTVQWIRDDEGLEEVVKESLLSEETRPRATRVNNTLVLSLRGVNLNPGSDPEDMVALRLWADPHRVITTVKRTLLSVRDVAESLESGDGPSTTSEFIVNIAARLISRIGGTIDNIEDRLADLEEKVLDIGRPELRQELSSIRRESILLRRYLAPQREAMNHLYTEKISWLGEDDQLRIREVADQLIRYIEDLDSIRDRATVIHEELVSNISEQINNRMYVLSLAAAVFLPLGFLTGLFGINVGGIPGSEYPGAFPLFVLLLVAIAAALFVFLKSRKWM